MFANYSLNLFREYLKFQVSLKGHFQQIFKECLCWSFLLFYDEAHGLTIALLNVTYGKSF